MVVPGRAQRTTPHVLLHRGPLDCGFTVVPMRGWFSLIAVKVEKKFVGCSHARLVQLGSLFRFFNHRSLPCGSDGICDYYPRICVIGSPGFLLDPPAVYPAFYGGKCGRRSGPEGVGSAVPGLSEDSTVVPVPAKNAMDNCQISGEKTGDNVLNRQSRPLDAPSC